MRSTARRRILLIVNPRASAVSHRVLSLVAAGLKTRYDLQLRTTDARGHATEIAREACSKGFDGVVTFGGDGTANEAANGMDDPGIPLISLPGGSANVFCGVVGSPREIASATRQLLRRADDWRTRTVDAASVNGRRFLFNSGVGLDARVVEGVDARPDLKARWRQWWFVTQAARTLSKEYSYRPPRVTVRSEGLAVEGVAGIVQNGRPWTYFGSRPVAVSNSAALDSGMLSLSLLDQARPWSILPLGLRVLTGRGVEGHRRVTSADRTRFTFEAIDGEPFPVHVDGDHIGSFESAHYEIKPGALSILV